MGFVFVLLLIPWYAYVATARKLMSLGAIIHFLKELFKFVLSIARLFEHLIQVCVRIGQFSLHFFDNIMKGFLSRGDGVSRLI